VGLLDRFTVSNNREANHNWPTVAGEISEIDVRKTRRDGLVAEIVYSYCANGEYYSGIFKKKFPPFASEAHAAEYVARFENVNKILVHYNPAKPEVSTVFEQDMNTAV
jgi:hypothetical protein